MKKKNNIKKAINKIAQIILNILLIIVTLLILLGAYYLIQIRVFNNDYANIFRIYIF